jgi:hypothetical protein
MRNRSFISVLLIGAVALGPLAVESPASSSTKSAKSSKSTKTSKMAKTKPKSVQAKSSTAKQAIDLATALPVGGDVGAGWVATVPLKQTVSDGDPSDPDPCSNRPTALEVFNNEFSAPAFTDPKQERSGWATARRYGVGDAAKVLEKSKLTFGDACRAKLGHDFMFRSGPTIGDESLSLTTTAKVSPPMNGVVFRVDDVLVSVMVTTDIDVDTLAGRLAKRMRA